MIDKSLRSCFKSGEWKIQCLNNLFNCPYYMLEIHMFNFCLNFVNDSKGSKHSKWDIVVSYQGSFVYKIILYFDDK